MLAAVILALIGASAVLAQSDIYIGAKGPYVDIIRSAPWSGSGPGGLNNAFQVSPPSTDSSMCLYVANNNPTSTQTATATVAITGDQRRKPYLGKTAGWSFIDSWSISVGASTQAWRYFNTSGAATVVVSIASGSGQAGAPDTADVFAVFANSAYACPPGAGPITLQTGIADITGDGSAHSMSGIGTYASWVQFIGLPTNFAYFRIGDSTITTTRGGAVGPGAGMFLPPIAQGRYYDLTQIYYLAAVGDKISIMWAK